MTKQAKHRIRLLVVSQYFYPEQFRINDMCAEWVKRGYDVTVVTGMPNYPKGKFFHGYGWFKRTRDSYEGAKIIRLPIISRGSSKLRLGLNYLSFVVSGFFWQLFTRIKADIVFSYEVSPMTQVLPAVWYSRRRKIPCIAYIQDLWPESFQEMTGIQSGWIVRLLEKMTDYIYRECKLVLVTSKSFKKAVEKRGVPSEKVMFLPQYAEDFYKPSDIISPLVPADKRFTIAYTGNIGAAQGLEILPKTAVLLKNRGVSVRFLMVGDGRGIDILRKAIIEEEVANYFHFTPQQPSQAIPNILAGADAAFVSFSDKPLFHMTIPAKLQSYMACGVPILAAANGETRKAIKEAGCGFCCDPGDAGGLTTLIEFFLKQSHEVKKQMRDKARQYAVDYFDKTKLLNQLDILMKEHIKVGC